MSKLTETFQTSRHFALEKVTEGVFAAISKEGTGSMGNSGFVDLGEGVLIFDTFLTPQAAFDLCQLAEKLTGKPILYVVNSHDHGDHVRGNQVFSDVPILSTSTTRSIIEKTLPERARQQTEDGDSFLTSIKEKLEEETDALKRKELELLVGTVSEINESLKDFTVTLPTVCFENELTIHGSERKVVLKTWGGGHSASDSVLLLPDEKIAFAGDLLFVDTHLSMVHGDATEWVNSLKEFNKYEINTFIPGHGPVGDQRDFQWNEMYLTDVLEHCHEMVKKEIPVEEAVATFKVPHYASDWDSEDIIPRNIEAVYKQIKERM